MDDIREKRAEIREKRSYQNREDRDTHNPENQNNDVREYSREKKSYVPRTAAQKLEGRSVEEARSGCTESDTGYLIYVYVYTIRYLTHNTFYFI